MAAMAFVAIARPYEPSGWVAVPNVEKDSHVQYLGKFAVTRYNEQTKAYLEFIKVTEAEVLDRGTEHYTYKLVIQVHDGYAVKSFKSEALHNKAKIKTPLLRIAHETADFPIPKGFLHLREHIFRDRNPRFPINNNNLKGFFIIHVNIRFPAHYFYRGSSSRKILPADSGHPTESTNLPGE
ncbi:hypothetical protein EJ110_NYTH18564 [Nymphaea thermarum]|nr:hypothetical protein EJ110_NYTH18564 [Nymphaea thermarum]